MAGGVSTSLTSIPPALLNKFVHHVIDGLCGGASASHQHFQDCPLEVLWKAVQEVKTLARDVTANRLTLEEARNQLSPLGCEGAACVCDAVAARREDIREALVREALLPTRRLTDFDWNVRVAMSSSSVLDLKQPLLTLRLHTASHSSQDKDMLVEMTAAEVDALLVTLREAQASLSNLHQQK